MSGDLVRLANSSTLNLLSGTLLNVTGGSVATINGSLVRFIGSGNTINVTNSLAPTGFIQGIPVFSSLGATIGFSVTGLAPLTGLNTVGTIKINGTTLPTGATGGVTGSLIAIQTGGGTVRIGP